MNVGSMTYAAIFHYMVHKFAKLFCHPCTAIDNGKETRARPAAPDSPFFQSDIERELLTVTMSRSEWEEGGGGGVRP